MRTVRTNFDRQESRRDRRYALPLRVSFGAEEYTSDNWSLGGFQVTSDQPMEIGLVVTGTLRIEGGEHIAFSAQLVRHDPEARSFGFHFTEISPTAVELLDRVLARRLAGRRPS